MSLPLFVLGSRVGPHSTLVRTAREGNVEKSSRLRALVHSVLVSDEGIQRGQSLLTNYSPGKLIHGQVGNIGS